MKPCRPPDGSLLPAEQRGALFRMLRVMDEQKLVAGKVKPLLPQLAEELAAICTEREHFIAWADELERWVRWYRVPAFFLTFVFQLVTLKRKSIYDFLACNLYSDAQTNLADDLALNSLETAYNGYMTNRAVLGDSFQVVEKYLEAKLRAFHQYYYQWCRPFDYAECNPIADHLYGHLSHSWLEENFAVDGKQFNVNDEHALKSAIEVSQGDDFAYYGVLARRFLGLLYGARGQHDLSAEQYRLGLEQARQMRLDTEIGHLRRHYGAALRFLGNLAEARHQFEQAYAYERRFNEYCSYWQSLSVRELGDTLVRLAGRPVDVPLLAGRPQDAPVALDNPEELQPILNAYHDGRLFFDGHVAVQCPFPVSRAAKQQILIIPPCGIVSSI